MSAEMSLRQQKSRSASSGKRATRPLAAPDGVTAAPAANWQLEMFRFSLKKRQKLELLLELLGPLDHERCLLITCGDNPGSLNYHLRVAGGDWKWLELEASSIPQMEALLGEEVHHGRPDELPFADGTFDRVVVVDAHEHLDAVDALNREIARVLAREGAAIVTTPNGDTTLPLARLKRVIGMGPAVYGHRVQGYTAQELGEMMLAVGLRPVAVGAYARFFTELAELAINFGYVKLIGRKRVKQSAGEIAPRTAADLKAAGRSYQIYRRVYPLIRAFASLDRFVRRGGYAVAVAALKEKADAPARR
jgi:SAM-dependent methyltransferase